MTSAKTADGVLYTLEAPGARPKRFTERVWRALMLIDTVSTLDAWVAAVADPKITRERLAQLLDTLGSAGLLEARSVDDVERTAMHVIPSAAVVSRPGFELFSGEGGPVPTEPVEAPPPTPEAAPALPTGEDATPFEMAVDQAEDDGTRAVLDEPEPRRARLRRRVRRWAVLVAVGVGVLTIGVTVKVPVVLTYELELAPADARGVRPLEAGIVKTVLVKEGSIVKRGDVVATLSGADKSTALAKTTAQLERARAALDLRRRGARAEEIEKGRAAAVGLAREVAIAQARLRRMRQGVAQGVTPQSELDGALSAAAALGGQLAQAKAELALLQSGPRPEEMRMLEAEVVALEAQRTAAEESVAALTLTAPIDGVVVTPRVAQRVGARVEAGEELMQIAEVSEMIAEIQVAERDIDAVRAGLSVSAKVTAFPTDSFVGSVTQVAQQVERRNGAAFVLVEARIKNADGRLVPQMTGFAEISSEPRPLISVVTRRLIRWVRVRFLL